MSEKAGQTILSKTETTITSYEMILPGDSVLIGLSGGPDSVALLLLLHRLKKKFKIKNISAVHINHLIRPRSAKKEAELCEKLCQQNRIDFFYEEIDIPALTDGLKSGVEETARSERYKIFQRLREAEKFDKIALGHHRDDRVETILFNLCRGSGRRGLIGIPPARDRIIRPLYGSSRDEILSYLREQKALFCIDSSNKSMNFTRNRIRHRIIPALEKHISTSASNNIARLSDILTSEERFLNDVATKRYKQIHDLSPGGKNWLDLSKKFGYDEWLMRRLMMLLMADAGLVEISHEDVLALVDLVNSEGNKRHQIRGHLTAEKSGDSIYLYRPADKIEPIVLLDAENRISTVAGKGKRKRKVKLTYPRIWIKYEYLEPDQVKDYTRQPVTCAFIDGDKISGSLFVGKIKPGQRFHPFNRPGSKKVGDFLTDRKYPRPLRDELPIVSDEKGVVWIVGLEIDDRYRMTVRSGKMVKLEFGKY